MTAFQSLPSRVSSALILLSALALALSACGSKDVRSDGGVTETSAEPTAHTSPPPDRRAVNVVLISIDTLRADHLGCYGAPGNPTPNLDRFATDGVRFDRVYASVPVTTPSHATILTGTSPLYHGVRSNGPHTLPQSSETLAEVLRDAGYATAAFVGAFPLDRSFGVDQGFGHFDDEFSDRGEKLSNYHVERTAGVVVSRALEWLSRRDRERPFFLFVHVFDPHLPYSPPEPFRSRWSDDPYSGEIAYTDAEIGRLLAALAAGDHADSTLVAVLSDHGESLGEHDESTHGVFVYDSTLHVPLILRGPGIPTAKVVDEPVQLVDVMPTLAAGVGLEVPDEVQGHDLSVLFTEDGALPSDTVYYAESLLPQIQYGWAPLKSVREGRWKYIEAPTRELYDLQADPGETDNLWGREPQVQERLRGVLRLADERLSAPTSDAAARSPVGAETAQKLAALGYVGAFDADHAEGVDPMSLPDPKERIEIFNRIEQAFELIAEGRSAEALALYRELLDQYPGETWLRMAMARLLMESRRYGELVEILSVEAIEGLPPEQRAGAHSLRAVALQNQERWPEALREWQLLSRQYPEASDLAQKGLGHAHVKLGHWEEAAEHLARAKRADESDAETRRLLGQALLATGREAEGLEQLDAWQELGDSSDAPQSERQSADPRLHAARFYLELGRKEDATRLLREIARSSSGRDADEAGYLLSSLGYTVESLDYVQLIQSAHARGDRGDWAGAARDLQAAISAGADSHLVYYDLALCYINLGRWKQAHNALVRSIERDREFPPSLADFGLVQEAIGEPGHERIAEAHYRKAISLQPDFYPALLRLGSLMLRQGKVSEAILALEQAARAQPAAPDAYSALAVAYARAGRAEEASRARATARRLEEQRSRRR